MRYLSNLEHATNYDLAQRAELRALDDEHEQELTTQLGSPAAEALKAWLVANHKGLRDAFIPPGVLAAWLDEGDRSEGVVEIPARWSVTGAPVTFNLWALDGVAP